MKILNAVLTILSKSFHPETEKKLWTHSFFQTKFSLKMFLRKWRLKFWQHCRKLLTRSSKKLYEPIIFCKKTISLQRWLWKHIRKFHIPAEKISPKNRKKIMNLFVFSHEKVLQQCSSGKLECSFDNRLAKFSPEARQKFWKWRFFFRKISLTMILW